MSTSHELGAALGVAVISTIAGASLEGGGQGAAVGTGGFDNAFTACAIAAAVVAALGALLLPAGRPDPAQGPVVAHRGGLPGCAEAVEGGRSDPAAFHVSG
ncbi:hypothetical protein ACFPH6_06035 [Streptomyces xiangluensis]|uniref:Major facilitator superfamily (MFS) profile domain-containing protein n=1 Tax=Streptomyces xiangluensis TaxID=2665720 RepID=A0ABV8YFR4_9ACTN